MSRWIRMLSLGACVALIAVSAAGASTWRGLAALDLEGTSPTDPPTGLAANASGLAIVGWVSREQSGNGADGGVRIIERQPGAAWGARQTIKAPDGMLSGDIELALADDGFGVVTWNNNGTASYSARLATGVWGPVVPLTAASYDPQVAMQPDGQAVVVTAPSGTAVNATLIDKNGVATPPAPPIFTPPAGSAIDGVDVTIAGGATPTVVSILWHDAGAALHVAVYGIVFIAGVPNATPYYCGGAAQGDFDPPAAALTGAAPSFVFGSATVVADTVGGIATGYGITADAGATRRIVLARCQPAVAGWQQTVLAAGQIPSPTLALSAGRAVAAWGAPTGLAVTERDLRNGASNWSPTTIPITFASVGAADTAILRANVAFDSAGTAVVATDFLRPGELVLTSVHRFAGGTWTADSIDAQPADALASPYTPGVVSHRRGGFIATWRNPLPNRYPRTGDLDVEAPQLTVSGLPATVTGGQAVSMSVAATDNWSGFVPGSESWDFGDGSTATGASVAHTFVSPGAKTVVVTGRDAADNVGRTTIAVTVVPPTIDIKSAALVGARWKASRLSGKLRVQFTPPAAATLRLAITSADGKKTSLDKAVPTGSADVSVKLPPKLFPGRYLAKLSGTSGGATVTVATRAFTVPTPKEGVVSLAFLTSRRNGQPRTVITGSPTSLYAYITFIARPRGQVQVSWFGPKGARSVTSGPYRGKKLEFFVRDRNGLARGVWRARVTVKGRLAYELKIRLR